MGLARFCNANKGLNISLNVSPPFVSGRPGGGWEQAYLHNFGFDDSSSVSTAKQEGHEASPVETLIFGT